jgi:hypothetical protein
VLAGKLLQEASMTPLRRRTGTESDGAIMMDRCLYFTCYLRAIS